MCFGQLRGRMSRPNQTAYPEQCRRAKSCSSLRTIGKGAPTEDCGTPSSLTTLSCPSTRYIYLTQAKQYNASAAARDQHASRRNKTAREAGKAGCGQRCSRSQVICSSEHPRHPAGRRAGPGRERQRSHRRVLRLAKYQPSAAQFRWSDLSRALLRNAQRK